MGAGKVSFSDLSFMSTMRNSRPATILVASSTGSVEFIPEVVAMSFRPICIVAPCPGDWTNLLSMEVTSTLPEIECSNAALDWSWGTSNPTTAGGGGLGAGRVLLHGTGDGQLEELHNTDLDGDGAPDLAVRCTEVNSLPGTRGVVTTFSSPPTDHFSFRHTRTGHVTLMKFTDDEGEELRISTVTDPLSGETLLTPDFSSLGSTECDVVGLDPSGGEVFRTPWTSLQPPYALRSSTCPGEVVPTYGCDRNTLTFEGCDGGTLTIANPTIGIISGIARLRFEPLARSRASASKAAAKTSSSATTASSVPPVPSATASTSTTTAHSSIPKTSTPSSASSAKAPASPTPQPATTSTSTTTPLSSTHATSTPSSPSTPKAPAPPAASERAVECESAMARECDSMKRALPSITLLRFRTPAPPLLLTLSR
jgi:hypothetical protein